MNNQQKLVEISRLRNELNILEKNTLEISQILDIDRKTKYIVKYINNSSENFGCFDSFQKAKEYLDWLDSKINESGEN